MRVVVGDAVNVVETVAVQSETKEFPRKATRGSAGYDLKSVDTVSIPPGGRYLVQTGLRIALPDGYEAQVRPRSGLALKHGVTVLNAPGTIDSDYRGPIGVILYNSGDESFEVKAGDRIAQLVISKTYELPFVLVDDIDTNTTRGDGGFGSTGT